MKLQQRLKHGVLLVLVASVPVWGADSVIRVSDEGGGQVVRFKVGDSRCVLKDDQVQCAPISK